ncbi:hypothetical protein AE938_17020 [Bacteroides fragilis]|nr:hypothetical protein [Bacteroides fragilis]
MACCPLVGRGPVCTAVDVQAYKAAPRQTPQAALQMFVRCFMMIRYNIKCNMLQRWSFYGYRFWLNP